MTVGLILTAVSLPWAIALTVNSWRTRRTLRDARQAAERHEQT
jgi:hypothetical protein